MSSSRRSLIALSPGFTSGNYDTNLVTAGTRAPRLPSLLSARCPVQHAYIITCCHVITSDYLGGTLVKQPVVKSKQPVVTCFYCMKKGHLVRFCKIRKFSVPRGFTKWIPKGCEVPNEKKKSIGPTFVKGPNLVA